MGLLENASGYASAKEEFPRAVPLESLSECAVAEHQVIGQPLAVEEYITSDSDGNSLVVAREWGYSFQEIFVYYGPPGAVKQRELLKWARRRDGWTSVTFRVDDVDASAVFPVNCETRVGCPGELTLEGRRLALDASSKDAADLEGLTFLCATEVAP
jgi:hypothetical protein